MESLRDLKRRARGDLHEAMRVPALYLVETDPPTDPQEITVRVHSDIKALGDLKGTNFHYAERQEVQPRLVFLASEVQPVRGAVVSIEAGEAYRVDNVQPPDGITITVEALKLSAAEAAGLPVPTPPGGP